MGLEYNQKKNGLNKICFIAGSYPSKLSPNSAVFYQNLVHEFARREIECIVIHPRPINIHFGSKHKDGARVDVERNGARVNIYRPATITFGAKKLLFINTALLTAIAYYFSVRRAIKIIGFKPDILYAHFISPAGIVAAILSKKMNVPAFIAYGESSPWSIYSIGVNRCRKLLEKIQGFIAVSNKNKDELVSLQICAKEKVIVLPNGVDRTIFNIKNKNESRDKIGWDKNIFIVVFIGHFNERKGVLRLASALDMLEDVSVAFIGSGNLVPNCKNILYIGEMPHEQLPLALSAADVFVLPSLKEGCSNAIIEAMACGVPIISSNSSFNEELLENNKNALLINPDNIVEIREAIIKLKDDECLRNNFSLASLETIKKLDIKFRVNAMVEWIGKFLID